MCIPSCKTLECLRCVMRIGRPLWDQTDGRRQYQNAAVGLGVVMGAGIVGGAPGL